MIYDIINLLPSMIRLRLWLVDWSIKAGILTFRPVTYCLASYSY